MSNSIAAPLGSTGVVVGVCPIVSEFSAPDVVVSVGWSVSGSPVASSLDDGESDSESESESVVDDVAVSGVGTVVAVVPASVVRFDSSVVPDSVLALASMPPPALPPPSAVSVAVDVAVPVCVSSEASTTSMS